MSFTGFGPRAIEFYEGLAADNSKPYWQREQHVFTEQVAQPLQALAAALEPEFGEPKIFRPYRDLRFSADKRPYHEYARMGVRPDRADGTSGGVLWLGLSRDGLFLAAGYYEPSKEQLQRFRALQDDAGLTAELDALLADLDAAGYPLGEGNPVKTAPRGWAKDHPRIGLIRRTSLIVSRAYGDEPVLYSAACRELVAGAWRAMDRWNVWLDEHVGAGPPDRATSRR